MPDTLCPRFNRADALPLSDRYVLAVRAGNEAGWGAPTESQRVVALGLSTAPRSLAAVSARARQLIVTWDVPDDTGAGSSVEDGVVKSYHVAVSSTEGFETVLRSAVTAARDRRVVFEGLEPDTLVFVRAAAVTFAGEGEVALVQGTPVVPLLRGAAVTLSSHITGDTTDARLDLELATALEPTDRIEITLPLGFSGANAVLLEAAAGRDSLNVSLAGGEQAASFRFKVTLVANEAIPQAVPLTMTIADVKNAHAAGPGAPAWGIRTAGQGGLPIDMLDEVRTPSQCKIMALHTRRFLSITGELEILTCLSGLQNQEVVSGSLVPGELSSLEADLLDSRTARDDTLQV